MKFKRDKNDLLLALGIKNITTLARIIGYDRGYISTILNGNRHAPKLLAKRICQELDYTEWFDVE